MVTESVEQLCEQLAKAGIKAVKWGERNHVMFDNSKYEMIAFTRRWRPILKRRHAEVRIMVRGHTLWSNTEATQWLTVYLNLGL